MRRKTPEYIFLGSNLADVEAVGIEVLDLPQLTRINKLFKFDYRPVIMEDVAHHERQLVLFCQFYQFAALFLGQG